MRSDHLSAPADARPGAVRGQHRVCAEHFSRGDHERIGKPQAGMASPHQGGSIRHLARQGRDPNGQVGHYLTYPGDRRRAAAEGCDEDLRVGAGRQHQILGAIRRQGGDGGGVVSIPRIEKGDEDAGVEDD